MTFGSLFAGIGGIDLGLERAGWECRWQVEIDDYCRRVLTKHWPNVPKYGDIRLLSGDDLERVDLIAGGFPCQPVSLAGKRRGQDDARWLWPEVARLLGAIRPRYALLENVPGLLVRGLGDVLGNLSTLGFDAEWQTLPAAAFGAPHLRYRVWIVAYASDSQLAEQQEPVTGRKRETLAWRDGASGPLADAEGVSGPLRSPDLGRPWGPSGGGAGGSIPHPEVKRLPDWDAEPCSTRREAAEPERHGVGLADTQRPRLEVFPRQRGDFVEELATTERGCQWREWWATEPSVGRVANGVPRRVDRLRGLGNAVVPQCAEWIGRLILTHAEAVECQSCDPDDPPHQRQP